MGGEYSKFSMEYIAISKEKNWQKLTRLCLKFIKKYG